MYFPYIYFQLIKFKTCHLFCKISNTPWLLVCKGIIPTDRHLSAKLAPTFVGRGCHTVSATIYSWQNMRKMTTLSLIHGVFELYARIQGNCEDLEGNEHSGLPTAIWTPDIAETLRELISTECQMTLHDRSGTWTPKQKDKGQNRTCQDTKNLYSKSQKQWCWSHSPIVRESSTENVSPGQTVNKEY
jgi:hypothetical protein